MDRRGVPCVDEYVYFASMDNYYCVAVYRMLSGGKMILGIIGMIMIFSLGAFVGKLISDIRWIRFLREYDENATYLVRAYQDMLNGAVKKIHKLEKKIELGYDPEEDNG